MNKSKFESPDITAENVAKIAELFPGVVAEGKVNFDLLRSMLGEDVFGDEAYEFTWVGKRAAIAEAGRPIRKTLRPCVEESKNWDTTENLYIEGDNLDVLKLLQESYLGKVKMIYIDPPYNTGNDFIYRDDFAQSREEYDDEAGVYDEDGDRLFRNTETNGRFHSDWCSMMYPRLVISRNILQNDGIVFISIGENEVTQLRKICDEVFGEENFVAQLIWKNKYGAGGGTKGVASIHEYILVYSKQSDISISCELSGDLLESYSLMDEKYATRGGYVTQPLATTSKGARSNLMYEIHHEGDMISPPKGGRWIWSKERFEEAYNNNEVVINKTKTGYSVRFKQYLKDENGVIRKGTQLSMITNIFNQEGTKIFAELFGDKEIFGFPKPVALIKHLINLEINGYAGKDSIILDFFSGSATTAHAVMQLNAEDRGNRKFIMVQLPEVCAEGTEAAKAGYKNICEIGKERIRRAGERIVTSEQFSVFREEMEKYGCVKLSRSDCLAKGNRFNGGGLQTGKKIAERGTLFAVGSDEESSGINSIEYSRGTGQELKQGIRQLSFDSKRIESGTGDTTANMRQSGLPCRFGYFGSESVIVGNRQNAECPHFKTENCPLKTENFPDIGFRVLKLDDTNMNDVYYAAGDYTQDLVAKMANNIKEDRTDMDLLFGCLLDWGLPLSMPHSHEKIDGFTIHTYNDGDLIACFEEQVSEKAIREIAGRKPLRAVFRDSSFTSSPEKINVFEIFKLLAPNTNVRVI